MATQARCGAVALTLAVVVMAAPAATAADPIAMAFVTVAVGQRSAITTPMQTVVRDPAAWLTLWRRHTGGAAASLPAVDFQTAMVVAVFAGEAPASTTVAIRRVLAEPTRLVVYYTQGERRPFPLEAPEVSPYHIARIPRSERPVHFVRVKTPPVLGPGPSS